MGKVFKYIETKTVYDAVEDKNVDIPIGDYEYEASNDEIKDAILDLVFKEFFKKVPMVTDKREHIRECKKAISNFIDKNDLVDTLAESMDEDLKEYFEDIAYESSRD